MTKKLEQLKPVIERLYVKEGKPLNEVRDLIKAKFGLEVCVRTYKNAFEKWGWKKYKRRSRFPTYTVEEKDTWAGTELEATLAAIEPLAFVVSNFIESEMETFRKAFQDLPSRNPTIGELKFFLDELRRVCEQVLGSPKGDLMFFLDDLKRLYQELSGSPKGDKLLSMRADRLLKILQRIIYVVWGKLQNLCKLVLKTSEDLRILHKLLEKNYPETTTVCPICDTILTAQGGIMAKCENPECKMITAEEDEDQGMQIIQSEAGRFSMAAASASSRIEEIWEEDNAATLEFIDKVPKAVSANILDVGFTLEPVLPQGLFNEAEISFPVFPSQNAIQVESHTPSAFNEWSGQTMINNSPYRNFGSAFSPTLSSSIDNALGWTCWNQLYPPTYSFNYPASVITEPFPLSRNVNLPIHSALGFNPLFSTFSSDYNYLPLAGDPLYSINTSTFQAQNHEDVLQNKTYTWPNSNMNDDFLV